MSPLPRKPHAKGAKGAKHDAKKADAHAAGEFRSTRAAWKSFTRAGASVSRDLQGHADKSGGRAYISVWLEGHAMKRHGFTILVVEDEPDDQTLIKMAFESFGFTGAVQVVGNGAEAIAYMMGEGQPDRDGWAIERGAGSQVGEVGKSGALG